MEQIEFCKHLFRGLWVFLIKTIRAWNQGNIVADELESKALVLCRAVIRDPHTKLLYCPITNKRFIANRIRGIRIRITTSAIRFYDISVRDVDICEKSYKSLCRVFDGHVLMNGLAIEQAMDESIEESFDEMYQKQLNTN